jgi:hypothetical protein
MTAATLDQANATLRAAVSQRLDNTPKDDPKVATVSCCEGTRMRGDSLMKSHRHPSSTAFIELLAEMQRLHESKSADYGSEDDPLANVRSGADFVNIEPWRGCMVRIADKVQRLRTFCRTGRLVHEGVRDTLLDLAAYSLLAIVLHDEGRDA